MFLELKYSGYNRYAQQVASGRFLLFMQPELPRLEGCKKPIRCLVRHCSMRQLGQFMMGKLRVKGRTISVSGCYGNDGLPTSVAPEIYELGVELPQELYDAWNKGGGWNGAGSEAKVVREWALKTFAK